MNDFCPETREVAPGVTCDEPGFPYSPGRHFPPPGVHTGPSREKPQEEPTGDSAEFVPPVAMGDESGRFRATPVR